VARWTRRGDGLAVGNLEDATIELCFQRGRLATHPHREGGALPRHWAVHLSFEACRQWSELPAASDRIGTSPAELSDFELLELFRERREGHPQNQLRSAPELLRRAATHMARLARLRRDLKETLRSAQDRDSYGLLGLSPEASDAEVTRAYRSRARCLHPDRQGSTQAFQELQAAYEKLCQRRRQATTKSSGCTENAQREAPAVQSGSCHASQGHQKAANADFGDGVNQLHQVSAQPSPPAVSVESLARQAEVVIDLAQTCAILAKRCGSSPERESLHRPPSLDCCIKETACDASRIASCLGNLVVKSLQQVRPLLEQVGRQCSCLGDFKEHIFAETHVLSELLLSASSSGESTVLQAKDLMSALAGLGISGAGVGAAGARPTELSTPLRALAGRAVDAVLGLGETIVCAQRLARLLTAASDARGGGGPEDEQEEEDEEGARASGEDQDCAHLGSGDGDDVDFDDPLAECSDPLLKEQRLDHFWRRFASLNREVPGLQAELRTLVGRSPELIEKVSVQQKTQVFALLCEMLTRFAGSASRAFEGLGAASRQRRRGAGGAGIAEGDARGGVGDADHEQVVGQGCGMPPAVEEALGFLRSASAWRHVALPSFGARLLRLACLIDAALCRRLLHERLLGTCLAAARGKPGEHLLLETCSASVAALWPVGEQPTT